MTLAPLTLVALDLETTGTDVCGDRVVELAVIREEPGATHCLATRINPGAPIPPAATAVHGISDADVLDAPGMVTLIPAICEKFRGAHAVVGFNARAFDLPLLECEMRRAGHDGPMPWDGLPLLDAMELHRWLIPGTLAGAHRFWTGADLTGAHSASADAAAALRVLRAQLEGTPDLRGVSPAALEQLVLPADAARWLDPTGRFVRDAAGVPRLGFGKHKGAALDQVDAGFLRWMLGQSFHPRAKAVAQAELDRRLA